MHPWYEHMHVPFITPPLSHPLWNTSVFFMRITSRFFHLNAYDSNVTNKTFWRISLKQIIKWRQVNNQVTSYITFIYNIICFPPYTVDISFIVNPNFSYAGISYNHLNQNSEDLFYKTFLLKINYNLTISKFVLFFALVYFECVEIFNKPC